MGGVQAYYMQESVFAEVEIEGYELSPGTPSRIVGGAQVCCMQESVFAKLQIEA